MRHAGELPLPRPAQPAPAPAPGLQGAGRLAPPARGGFPAVRRHRPAGRDPGPRGRDPRGQGPLPDPGDPAGGGRHGSGGDPVAHADRPGEHRGAPRAGHPGAPAVRDLRPRVRDAGHAHRAGDHAGPGEEPGHDRPRDGGGDRHDLLRRDPVLPRGPAPGREAGPPQQRGGGDQGDDDPGHHRDPVRGQPARRRGEAPDLPPAPGPGDGDLALAPGGRDARRGGRGRWTCPRGSRTRSTGIPSGCSRWAT